MKTEVLLFLFSYAAFFMLCRKNKKDGCLKLFSENGEFTSRPLQLTGVHFLGMVLFGVIPLLFLEDNGMQLLEYKAVSGSFAVIVFAVFFSLLMVIAFWQSRLVAEKIQPSGSKELAVMVKPMIAYFVLRLFFLIAYEFWFRGLLLFGCVNLLGIVPAVIVNVALYTLIHVFSGKKEMLVCIPFGVLVCYFSLAFHSVLPAVLLHVCFSMVYECMTVRYGLNNLKIQML